MADSGQALATLKETRKAARRAVNEIQARKKDAYDRHDYDAYERCVATLPAALDAEHFATQRLIGGIIDPSDDAVVKLSEATAELNARIEAFKADAAALADLANILSIVTHAVLLIGLV